MRIFNETTRTYKTQENAIKAANKIIDLDSCSWTVGVNDQDRFFIIVKSSNVNLCHHGICIIN